MNVKEAHSNLDKIWWYHMKWFALPNPRMDILHLFDFYRLVFVFVYQCHMKQYSLYSYPNLPKHHPQDNQSKNYKIRFHNLDQHKEVQWYYKVVSEEKNHA